MKHLKLFEQFVSEILTESKSEELIQKLHFAVDPAEASAITRELERATGWRSDDVDYMLKRYRKSIGEEDLGLGLYPEERLENDRARAKAEADAESARKKAMKWNKKRYMDWVKDVASNGGWQNAADMARNAEFEPGLMQWAKKEFRGEHPLQRIQWDIEAYAE